MKSLARFIIKWIIRITRYLCGKLGHEFDVYEVHRCCRCGISRRDFIAGPKSWRELITWDRILRRRHEEYIRELEEALGIYVDEVVISEN